jgi:hypothetical protein
MTAKTSTYSDIGARSTLVSPATDPLEAALRKGAKEVARGTVFYTHGGTLWSVPCKGQDIGAWEEGYPGTEDAC